MNDAQLQAIVGLMGGFQAALVILVKALQEQGAINDLERLTEAFERQASSLPEETTNRDMIVMVLRHVVTGLRDPGHDSSAEIERLLH